MPAPRGMVNLQSTSFTYLFLAEDGLQLLDVLCLECEELLGLGVEYELHLLVGKLVSNSIRWVYR